MAQEEGPRRWGFAYHVFRFPSCQVLFVQDDDTFCRHCEHTIPAGKPFTVGEFGKYGECCLVPNGWAIIADTPAEGCSKPEEFPQS